MVKALDSKERTCQKVVNTYQISTYSSEIRLDAIPSLLARLTAISSRKETHGKKNELSEKQKTPPKKLDRIQKPRIDREPEKSCGNNNVLLRAELWAALGGTRTD